VQAIKSALATLLIRLPSKQILPFLVNKSCISETTGFSGLEMQAASSH